MATGQPLVMKLDPDALRAIKSLTRVVEQHNRIEIEKERARREEAEKTPTPLRFDGNGQLIRESVSADEVYQRTRDILKSLKAVEFGRDDYVADQLKVAGVLAGSPSTEYYDEDTLMKVAEAIRNTELIGGGTVALADVQNMISAMQNKGILFRERR